MNYSHLTKKQVINGIKNGELELIQLANLSEAQQDDKDIVLAAIKNHNSLEYASDRLKDDKSVVMVAVKNDGGLLEYASERLKDDKEIVLEAVKKNGLYLNYASERLQNNKELLKILEKEDPSGFYSEYEEWYAERMEVLDLLKEKELMERRINTSNKVSKRVKF